MQLKQISERLSIKIECTSSGSKTSKIVIVGEAPGREETIIGSPFVGGAGRELDTLLREAGIQRKDCFLTNVFEERPADNKLLAFCAQKLQVNNEYQELRQDFINNFPDYPWPPIYNWEKISVGNYIRPQYLPHLVRLKREIEEVKPNLILALGGTATWALCGRAGIKNIRGSIADCNLVPGIKVLPTFHPAYILRVWDDRLVFLADLMKAARHINTKELLLPQRHIYINPNIADIENFYKLFVENSNSPIAYDIETKSEQVTCIAFAPSKNRALVIPFFDNTKPDGNYWSTIEEELLAWQWVKKFLETPNDKITQNGAYDIQYLWFLYGLRPKGKFQDTLLLHHAMYSELEKSLGFLGSLYTEERSWKLLRYRAKDEMLKKDA